MTLVRHVNLPLAHEYDVDESTCLVTRGHAAARSATQRRDTYRHSAIAHVPRCNRRRRAAQIHSSDVCCMCGVTDNVLRSIWAALWTIEIALATGDMAQV